MNEADLSARSNWSGTITFGLVSIPVTLFPATRTQRIGLRMVDQDGTPLSRRYVCPNENRPVEWAELVRGYEIAPGEFVVVTDDELEALEPHKSRDIDLRQFVPVQQLDPRFFQRGYYLTPAGESTKAYVLLATIMEQSRKAGIATFVMRGKEYLTAIVAEHGILRAETLRFADEIRSADQVGLPARPRLKAAEVKKLETEIGKHVAARLSPDELVDPYAERLLALVRRKERKDQDVVAAPHEEEAEEGEEVSRAVIDLMEVLRQSLRPGGSAGKKARKSGRKTATGKAGKTTGKAARKSVRKSSPKRKTA